MSHARVFLAVIAGLGFVAALTVAVNGQIPIDRVLKRVAVPSAGGQRGLVDIVGFPQTAEQMTAIGEMCERLEKDEIAAVQQRHGFSPATKLVAGWCPHDDYMLAGRVYAHVERYIKAKTVILIGNAHWSEAFGVREKLVFDDFERWRGPYAPVRVSPIRAEILAHLSPESSIVNRSMVETEHSLEALVPFLQYYNRSVEIVPILVPVMPWDQIQARAADLARAIGTVMTSHHWKLGEDVAILVSGDGQHYGDYGWSYYDYHPFGCDAPGYQQAMELDHRLVSSYMAGPVESSRIKALFSELVDQDDVGKYKITWCGRFAVPLGITMAGMLTQALEHRALTGYPLREGTSLAFPRLPLETMKLGLTGDANLHHFVTYQAVGFK
jgi:AmmeMemoRadiSam system protein B